MRIFDKLFRGKKREEKFGDGKEKSTLEESKRKEEKMDINSLMKKLETTDRSQAEKIIPILAQMGEVAVGPLINALYKNVVTRLHPQMDFRDIYFAEALARIGQPSVKQLIEVLPLTTYAHYALGLIGGEETFQALLKELKTGDWMRVEAAAKALGEIGDVRALNVLKFNTTSAEVSWACNKAISKIERKQIGETEWLKVDTSDPYAQVKRVWDFSEEICNEPHLLEKAIIWHKQFVKAMPDLHFASDKERGHTWVMLGSLAIFFRTKKVEKATAEALNECEEAKYCFKQCLRYLSNQDISLISNNEVQKYLKSISNV